MKKTLCLILSILMILSLCACGDTAAAPAAEKQTFKIGICQLVKHDALDKASQGFMDAIKDELGDSVEFDYQLAAGDIPTCATICNGFASDGVDLILANATPALQAAAAATDSIPVLGTAITEYGVALDINDFNGTVGGNISGTSDLAPLDQQAQMIVDLIPGVQKVAILFCSSEANSVYQAKVVTECLEKAGVQAESFTFSDSNDVTVVTTSACDSCDVLYIPTDNTAASCAEAIGLIADEKGIPVITGEEGPCAICGLATLSIDYYDLGVTTGKMAVKILKGEANISDMAIEYFPEPVKTFNPATLDALNALGMNIVIPDDYIAIE